MILQYTCSIYFHFVLVALSLVFCIVCCRHLFVVDTCLFAVLCVVDTCLFACPLCAVDTCLFACPLCVVDTCLFACPLCAVDTCLFTCPFHLAIVLFVLRFTVYDNPFGVFKLFLFLFISSF